MEPRVTYDRNVRALTVELEEGSVAGTVAFDEEHLLDLDEDGQVLAVEVLTPDDPKIAEMATAYGFEDRVPEILVAILNALVAPSKVETGAKWIDMSSSMTTHVVLGPTEWKTASASGPLPQRKLDPVS
jgi:uncharacterized protein YuzE